MHSIIIAIASMSVTGAYVIAVIIITRFLLSKAPRSISYALWAVAGFRLVSPFTLVGPFSLIPFHSTTVTEHLIALCANVGGSHPGWLTVVMIIWAAGCATMATYGLVSAVGLARRLRNMPTAGGDICILPATATPFVFGVAHPRIYCPNGLPDDQRQYVIAHEQAHIRRHDHVIKLVAWAILCVHWFNPLAWAAFKLMETDMEQACDETVLAGAGVSAKKDYASLLLSFTSARRGLPIAVAFGEGQLKSRITNALNVKKPTRGLLVASVSLSLLVSLGLAVNWTGNTATPTITTADLNAFFDQTFDAAWNDDAFQVAFDAAFSSSHGDTAFAASTAIQKCWQSDVWAKAWVKERNTAVASGTLLLVQQATLFNLQHLSGSNPGAYSDTPWYHELYADSYGVLTA